MCYKSKMTMFMWHALHRIQNIIVIDIFTFCLHRIRISQLHLAFITNGLRRWFLLIWLLKHCSKICVFINEDTKIFYWFFNSPCGSWLGFHFVKALPPPHCRSVYSNLQHYLIYLQSPMLPLYMTRFKNRQVLSDVEEHWGTCDYA